MYLAALQEFTEVRRTCVPQAEDVSEIPFCPSMQTWLYYIVTTTLPPNVTNQLA